MGGRSARRPPAETNLYRCKMCARVVGPGVAMLLHTVYRPNKSIAAQFPVCGACSAALADGVRAADLMARHGTAPSGVRLRKTGPADVGRPARMNGSADGAGLPPRGG
jgi:hypothetical protein